MASEQPHERTSAALAADVSAIVAAAEQVADSLKQEADERGEARLRQAEREAERIIAAAREQADSLVEDRRRRIAELSDAVLRSGEALLGRIGSAQDARAQLEDAVSALGHVAALLTREVDAGQAAPAQPGRADPAAGEEVDSPPEAAEHRRWRIAGGEMRASQILGRTRPPAGAPPATEPPAEVADEAPDPPAEVADEAPEPPAEVPDEAPAPSLDPTAADDGGAVAGTQDEAPGGGAAEHDDPLSSARLLALNMAVGGSSRVDTQRELRRALGVADPGPIVDEVFEAYEARR